MTPDRNPRAGIERYAVLGTVVGGTSAAISALACGGPLAASVVIGTLAAAAAGAVYGYVRGRNLTIS